jgi:hypothetical protein
MVFLKRFNAINPQGDLGGSAPGFAFVAVHATVQDDDFGWVLWFIVHMDERNGIKSDKTPGKFQSCIDKSTKFLS